LASAATFARLAELIAIPDASARPTRSVVEVFTGKELTTIPGRHRTRREGRNSADPSGLGADAESARTPKYLSIGVKSRDER
jgi:hypothetical protein